MVSGASFTGAPAFKGLHRFQKLTGGQHGPLFGEASDDLGNGFSGHPLTMRKLCITVNGEANSSSRDDKKCRREIFPLPQFSDP
jgi:hypothetical protein